MWILFVIEGQSFVAPAIDVIRRFAALAKGRQWFSLFVQHIALGS